MLLISREMEKMRRTQKKKLKLRNLLHQNLKLKVIKRKSMTKMK
mgnify:CR=1 FL=1